MAGKLIFWRGKAVPARPPAIPPVAAGGAGGGNDEEPPPSETWQGYSVRHTENHGVEFTVRTSRANHLLWFVPTAILTVFALVVWQGRSIPDEFRPHDYSDIGLYLVTTILIMIATALLVAISSSLPDEWKRVFYLETCELRPDGITINQKHFFPRERIFSCSVSANRETGVTGFDQAFIIIDGTKRLELLSGMDPITALVFKTEFQRQMRRVWEMTAPGATEIG